MGGSRKRALRERGREKEREREGGREGEGREGVANLLCIPRQP